MVADAAGEGWLVEEIAEHRLDRCGSVATHGR
jgi:hypothetical protein